jgi:hypothetical protein
MLVHMASRKSWTEICSSVAGGVIDALLSLFDATIEGSSCTNPCGPTNSMLHGPAFWNIIECPCIQGSDPKKKLISAFWWSRLEHVLAHLLVAPNWQCTQAY